jgi:uracil-DNA glycosylase
VADPARQLAAARRDAAGCRRCDLWARATQVVFGEGRPDAPLMLVGEQPGDAEDRAGHPFVGPAGTLLRHVLDEVGVDEADVYLTNAVKHFKWKERGTRRIHDKPSWTEVKACGHWLRLELATATPELVVCLGGTAAQALLGRDARVGELRGRVLDDSDLGVQALVTLHPSAVLRAGERRAELRAQLVEDLAFAREVVAGARTTG